MRKESPTGFLLSSFTITLLRDEAWLHLLMSPVVDERLKPVHGWFSLAGVSTLCFLQCFDRCWLGNRRGIWLL